MVKIFLELKATEQGTNETKTIRLDVIFEHDNNGVSRFRVNVEPQSKRKTYSENNSKSYSLVARAMYYAGVLMATELQTEEEYHNIRKVYSVWICYERPIADVDEPIIRYSMRPEEPYYYNTLKDGQRETIYANRHKFDDGDLISVIMISVPAIEKIIKKTKCYFDEKGMKRCFDSSKIVNFADSYNAELLMELYELLSNKVKYEERSIFLRESKIDKGVKKSMDIVEQTIIEAAERVRKAEEEAKEMVRKAQEEAEAKAEEELEKLRKELEKYKRKYKE